MAHTPGAGTMNPPPSDRLFFALYPDAATAARIEACARAWRQQFGLTGSVIHATRLHVTISYLGEFCGVPHALVQAAACAAAALTLPSPVVHFDRLVSFDRPRGKRPLVMRTGAQGPGAQDVLRLHDRLEAALRQAGVPTRSGGVAGFVPHLTLLYDRARVPESVVDPVIWTADRLSLMRSLLGRSQHEALASWAMAASPRGPGPPAGRGLAKAS